MDKKSTLQKQIVLDVLDYCESMIMFLDQEERDHYLYLASSVAQIFYDEKRLVKARKALKDKTFPDFSNTILLRLKDITTAYLHENLSTHITKQLKQNLNKYFEKHRTNTNYLKVLQNLESEYHQLLARFKHAQNKEQILKHQFMISLIQDEFTKYHRDHLEKNHFQLVKPSAKQIKPLLKGLIKGGFLSHDTTYSDFKTLFEISSTGYKTLKWTASQKELIYFIKVLTTDENNIGWIAPCRHTKYKWDIAVYRFDMPENVRRSEIRKIKDPENEAATKIRSIVDVLRQA